MTLEESNVIVFTLLSAQPYRKVTRSKPHVARLDAISSSSFTSSSSSAFFATEATRSETDIGTGLRTKMRETTNSDVPFDFDQTRTQDLALQFAASLTSSGISLPESGIEIMSTPLDPPFPPLVQHFSSGSLYDNPNQMIQIRSTTTADRDRNSDNTFFEPIPVQVLQVPKRSHRKKVPSDEQKGKKRSRDRSTQKKGEKIPPPPPSPLSPSSPPVDSRKNHKSNMSEFQSVSGSRNRTRTGSDKTILPSSSSSSSSSLSKTKMTVIRGQKEKEIQQEPQEPQDVFFLSDDSPPMEFFPIGDHPGSTSPLMPLHPREGATPRGVSAALVLLTTKSSVMTTLASPQPTTRTLATSATTSSDMKLSKKQKHKKEQQKLQPSSRSSPMGGSPIKMCYSSRDEEHEATEAMTEISSSSSSSSSSSTLPSFLSDSITSTVGNTIASTIALATSAISSLTRQSHHLPLLFLHNQNPHNQKGNEQVQEEQSQTKQDEDILLLFGIPVLPLTS